MTYSELYKLRELECSLVDSMVAYFSDALAEVMSEKEFEVGKYTRHDGGWTCQRQMYFGVPHWRWVLEPPSDIFLAALAKLHKECKDCRLAIVPTSANCSLWLRNE